MQCLECNQIDAGRIKAYFGCDHVVETVGDESDNAERGHMEVNGADRDDDAHSLQDCNNNSIEEQEEDMDSTDSDGDNGENILVGALVRKKFAGQMFEGIVTRYDADREGYWVYYDDDDNETMKQGQLEEYIVRNAPRTRRHIHRPQRRMLSSGTGIVGQSVELRLRGTWYEGVVCDFDPEAGIYAVKYGDGEVEAVRPGKLARMLQAPPPRAAQADTEVNHADREGSEEDAVLSEEEAKTEDLLQGTEAAHPDVQPNNMQRPTTLHQAHQKIVADFSVDEASLQYPLHRDYKDSGVMLKFAVPTYTLPNERYSLLQWQAEQDDKSEFGDPLGLTDANCMLDFAKWIQKNQVSHRGYQQLIGLIRKWLPLDLCFPPSVGCERQGGAHAGGEHHPGAFLLRLKQTRKSLEEHIDRRIVRRQQAHALDRTRNWIPN